MTNDVASVVLEGLKYPFPEYYKDQEVNEAIDTAIHALHMVQQMRQAYESDYQVQDVIEVCTQYWG